MSIVYADHARPREVLEEQLRNVAEPWLRRVNENRRASGLPVLFAGGRPWMRNATPPPAPRHVRALPPIVLVCRVGVGDIGRGGRVEPEVIAPDAFADSHRAIRSGAAPFVFRSFGHGTRPTDATGSGTFDLSPLYPSLPVAVWRPDGRDQRHVDAVEQIERGNRSLSLEFRADESQWIDGVRHVARATLMGVALCPPDQRACYRGSLAIVADCRPSHVNRSIMRCVSLCRSVADGDIDADDIERHVQRLGGV